jgi:Domain of unknown function (DUF4432)
MAHFLGKEWKKTELRRYLSNIAAVAGAVPFEYSDGKADGVRGIAVTTGSGLSFNVLPGRAMDIYECRFRGTPLHFSSSTGVTAPAYYEEPGLRWLRTFFGGLLSTCGITYSGAPCTDQGEVLGLHGRIGSAGAENLRVCEEWDGDDYRITVGGRMREASVMGENLVLTRTITTMLGAKSIRIEDTIENLGFSAQPLQMLYHFNFGFPLLSERSHLVAPIISTVPRDDQAAADNGVAECRDFSVPTQGYKEKVFFHDVATDGKGRTFVALINPLVGDAPMGVVLRYDKKALPKLTEWKMIGTDCYVCGLEPGTANPVGRAAARSQGELMTLAPQEVHHVAVDFEVLDSREELASIDAEARKLASA